jgi:hypothetical protein
LNTSLELLQFTVELFHLRVKVDLHVFHLIIHVLDVAVRVCGRRRTPDCGSDAQACTFVALAATLSGAPHPSASTFVLFLRLHPTIRILAPSRDRTHEHAAMPPGLHANFLQSLHIQVQQQIGSDVVLHEHALVT